MGIVLTVLSLLVSQMASWQLGVVAMTWGIAQTLEPLVITPRIVGGRVGLHPAAIILAVLGFGELFGFVGVLLAVPTTATLLVVARVLLDRYRESAFYVGPAA
jgi:predicted PurR-regulated permease PerM